MLLALRRTIGLARQSRAWRPATARLLLEQAVHRRRNEHAGLRDEDHLRAAADWLERAQDATHDGGVSGRYHIGTGWSSSYPETTGYLIPTLMSLADALGEERFRERAARCVEFLDQVQLATGAFPAGEVHENRTTPSVFNSAQILHGIVQFHLATGDERALGMARRAADWLVAQQDEDGAFRKHAYNELPVAYASHASCWIAEAGAALGEPRWLESARRHLDWTLAQCDPTTGWFDHMGFDARDASERMAVTHTIAYTLWGILHTSVILGRADGVAAVRRAATAIARRLELSRRLPGVLDCQWRGRARFTCLTGNAQMALIWLRLHAMEQDFVLLNAALKAIDDVKAAQPMSHPNLGIRGGIPGSDPVWGDYIRFALPNWAAKYFVDALLAKRAALSRVGDRARDRWQLPADVPHTLPPAAFASGQPLRVVLYTRDGSHKVPQMIERWSAWGFRPAAVVVETVPVASASRRIITRVRDDGVGPLVRRFVGPRSTSAAMPAPVAASEPALRDVAALCATRRIPVVRVGRLDEPASIEAVRDLRPDLAIHAGAGILRGPLLAIPRLGTLNAHMGLLPWYRGMNVAEWARFGGGTVGCTVHLVDPGIDTGDILCTRATDARHAGSIAELRAMVDRDQMDLLGAVVGWIIDAGTLPARRAQRPDEGKQFFRMHPELARVLERELSDGIAMGAPNESQALRSTARATSAMAGV
ncbi:MAG: formyltransferase family protein [Gemmatimonadaceae bacterium]